MAKDKLKPITNKDVTKKIRPVDDEEEETYIYETRKMAKPINENGEGVFDIKKQSGINTQKSVFDKGSIFNTNL